MDENIELVGMTMSMSEVLNDYVYPLAKAILVLIVGFWFAGLLARRLKRTLEKREVSVELRGFLGGLVSALLKAVVVITALKFFGVDTTSFAAILAAAGLAVGMALSGTLSNFAGGVMIMLFKPFKVGHVIEAQGYTGSVRSIEIFNTIMMTPDNRRIIIPNGPLAGGSMINYSTEDTRRVDFTIGIGYDDDIDKAKQTMQKLIEADDRILKDPAPFIGVSELADSSVNFAMRVWVNSPDYWGVFFDMNENVKKTFDTESIGIPYPQMYVHVSNQ